MRWWIKIVFLNIFFLLIPAILYANNISVYNTLLGTYDTDANTRIIQLSVSWENSWRDSYNWDAAWVFVKYSTDNGATWKSATLKATDGDTDPTNDGTGWSIGSGTALSIYLPTHSPAVSGDKKGAFIYRSTEGTGTLTTTAIKFVWDYGTDGVTDTQIDDPANTIIRVMAIEMVYVPQGSYWAGDTNMYLGIQPKDGTNTDNVQIDDSAKIIAFHWVYPTTDPIYEENTGILIDGDGGIDMDGATAIDNPNYPTGYKAFYIMKYKVSQGEYKDFLNTLSSTQASTRYPGQNGNSRHTITVSSGVYSTNTPERDCNYLGWPDLAAYADWAGLRPMTQLEFCKACRGPDIYAPGADQPWADYQHRDTAYTLTEGTDGQSNETVTEQESGINGEGNALVSASSANISGPIRSGIFAKSNTSRAGAGAGYTGVMDMASGLWDMTVIFVRSLGRNFTGIHGDGSLSANGNANTTDWPGLSSGEVTSYSGAIIMGNAWNGGLYRGCVAGFAYGEQDGSNCQRASNTGGRCVRSAY